MASPALPTREPAPNPTITSSSSTSTSSSCPPPPESWADLFHASPSSTQLGTFSSRPRQDGCQIKPDPLEYDSSDSDTESENSLELTPDTGFDPFQAATRRARQNSLLGGGQVHGSSVSSSPATSDDASAGSEKQRWFKIDAFWQKVVEQVMMRTRDGPIDLSAKNITDIMPSVADLSRYVALAPPRFEKNEPASSPAQAALVQSRSGLSRHESLLAPFSSNDLNEITTATSRGGLSRTQSAAVQLQPRTARFERSASAASVLSTSSSGSSPLNRDAPSARNSQGALSIFLGSNQLTKIPSGFFQLVNLRILSLRGNKLEVLPPAIGDLQNLYELHIGNNQLTYLPAEIQRLRLGVFTHFPNPFLAPPAGSRVTERPILSLATKSARRALLMSEEVNAPPSPMSPVAVEVANLHAPPPVGRRLASRNRGMDRTRSEAQVEGFLARGIEQLGLGTNLQAENIIDEGDEGVGDNVGTLDETQTQTQTGAEEEAESEEVRRARILEAAFDEDEAEFSPLSSIDADTTLTPKVKVEGRSRVLGPRKGGDLPSLQELCIRKLLSPYDVTEDQDQDGFFSPFLSPSVFSTRSSSSLRRASSRVSTPRGLRPASLGKKRGAGLTERIDSFASSSSYSPSGSRGAKRIPTLIEAYENGTLQSLNGELGRGLVPLLEAARRSATGDWGTKMRMKRTNSNRKAFERVQSALGAFPTREAPSTGKAAVGAGQDDAKGGDSGREEPDPFGGVEVVGSLDRGDDANENPWFSRCPNPRHLEGSNDHLRSKHATPARWAGGEPRLLLDRSRTFGSTSSVSSLGTALGGGGGGGGAESRGGEATVGSSSSTGTSNDGRLTPDFDMSGSTLNEGGLGPWPTFAGTPQANHPSFGASSTRNPSFSSSGLGSGPRRRLDATTTTSGGALGLGRTFSRGFSTASAFARPSPSSPSKIAGRDWPLEEGHEQVSAPIFRHCVESRLEWVSHIGGNKIASVREVEVEIDLNDEEAGGLGSGSDPGEDESPPAEQGEGADINSAGTSSNGAGGGMNRLNQRTSSAVKIALEKNGFIPILWRGCSKGCLDFLG
ncbi:hypothetical protein IE53DRAFT_383307 [Violaceomyces palustris]|uniref:Uncharacterized protein n=1 Tax=Violaceomyces palustris TaxID=1673888 RepID=A0ACD0P7X2_9BASI|nr:hypothetical protein IE53DRAFT_383307 [Violaceomyces palustris]